MTDKTTEQMNETVLAEITGGMCPDDTIIDLYVAIFARMGIIVTADLVRKLVAAGGSSLRNFAKDKSGGNPLSNLFPVFPLI